MRRGELLRAHPVGLLIDDVLRDGRRSDSTFLHQLPQEGVPASDDPIYDLRSDAFLVKVCLGENLRHRNHLEGQRVLR